MKVVAIVACSKNRAIGKDNQIPWYLPADLQFFKKNTLHHTILMGRKTYESIGRPLPERKNIIITRQADYNAEGCAVYHSVLDGINAALHAGDKALFVIGGGEIYRQALAICHEIYYTEIDVEILDATVFFPEILDTDWKLSSEESHQKDQHNPYNYTFKHYLRKQPITLLDLHEK